MPEAEAVARVLREPELDGPRLALAAIVGGDRARAIDHGIRARNARRERLDDTAFRHAAKQLVLVRKHLEWTAPISALVEAVHVGRGFVEGVTLPLAAWREQGPELVALAPIVHLKIVGIVHGRVTALASDPLLARIRSLDLDGCQLDDDDLRALVASPHLGQLRWLGLARNEIGRAGHAALAEATPRLLGLRYVNLALNDSPDPTDEAAIDEVGNVRWLSRPEGIELEQRYGELPWLHAAYLDADREIFYVT